MIRKLKILAKNGQISMKKSFKNGRFCPIFDEKRHCGIIQFAGRGFFLKNDAGTRAALFKIFKLCNFALFAFRFNVLVTWFNQKFCGSQKKISTITAPCKKVAVPPSHKIWLCKISF